MTRRNVHTGIAAIAVLAGAGLLAGCAGPREHSTPDPWPTCHRNNRTDPMSSWPVAGPSS